jgi:hypothetical protein
MSRKQFFLVVFATGIWHWFPGYIFTALSVFNWVAPNNVVIKSVCASMTGLGTSVLVFDCSMASAKVTDEYL